MASKELLITVCDFPECRKPPQFIVKSHSGYEIGRYCTNHSDIKVREWNQREGK